MSSRSYHREKQSEPLVVSKTHVGLQRSNNQDYLDVRRYDDGSVLAIIADGMGGHAGGEVASRIAVETFLREIDDFRSTGGLARTGDLLLPESELRRGLVAANREIHAEVGRSPDLRGMGTTLVAASIVGNRCRIINIGDSRAYVIGRDGLHLVTDDHSLVNELVRRGEITPQEAEIHPRRNVLSRALGTGADAKGDIFEVTLSPDDLLLLCSDGLHSMLTDHDINRIVMHDWTIDVLLDALIDGALDAGGKDNVSIILVAPGYAVQSGEPFTSSSDTTQQGVGRYLQNDRNRLWTIVGLVAALALIAWLIYASGIFSSSNDSIPTDSTGVDSNGILLDSTEQLNPSEYVGDSLLVSDSIVDPKILDSLRRERSRRDSLKRLDSIRIDSLNRAAARTGGTGRGR